MEQLITACREAGQHPEGIALYKVGKTPGLFSSRSGSAGEAAQTALAAGYLELLHTDAKVEIVRLTPRGETFLREHLDPKPVLEELLQQLQTQQQAMPRWLAEIDAQLASFRMRSLHFLEEQGRQLARLTARVESALKRLQQSGKTQLLEPWQVQILMLLDTHEGDYLLSEVYHQLEKSGIQDLTIPEFQHGLLLLRDRGNIELVQENKNTGPLEEPEFAVIDEGRIFVAIRRA
ncbi:MAG TPA: hypothetical protein PKA06_00100 [Gemmatales bacterium]|nr:hypothetical protein [Gemmatales bacterium]HMP17020.1 hypothetical protein [Gemmatales bacterium]